MEEVLKEQLRKEKIKAYHKNRWKAIKDGTWEEKKTRNNLEGMTDEEKRIHNYNLKVERRKQYTIEVEKGKAALFDERLKQYGDKASKIFRAALDQYLDTHPDIDILKRKAKESK